MAALDELVGSYCFTFYCITPFSLQDCISWAFGHFCNSRSLNPCFFCSAHYL